MPPDRADPGRPDPANLIWEIAPLLRGPYQSREYGRVMLPLTVLRRLDCVLAATKPAVLAEYERIRGEGIEDRALEQRLNRVAGQRFHNRSPVDFGKLRDDPDHVEERLAGYIDGFSRNVRDIFASFGFAKEIERMAEAKVLYLLVSSFSDIDLDPGRVPSARMGLVFRNLIHRFRGPASKRVGDHLSPRDVVQLMVRLLFVEDDERLAEPGTVHRLLDPACGTGGMLAEARHYLRDRHPTARLAVFGQDYNPRAFAIAASETLMTEVDDEDADSSIRFGDTLTEDRFADETFDYFLANPSFGVHWRKQRRALVTERDKRGDAGRFGAGLPRVSDGSLLFLLHMWHKRKPFRPAEDAHGSRLAIVFSGSPLFAGGAGSGESNIRRRIIEEDWLEAVVALPEGMFFGTSIGTFIWVVTNRKSERRRGRVQLLDAREVWTAGRGDGSRAPAGRRRHLAARQIDGIVRHYREFAEGETCKILDNVDLGHTRVTVERPLRLRYRMTPADKARLLDACPHLLDDVQAIDAELGREPMMDWNTVWSRITKLLRSRGARWTIRDKSAFREVFTRTDPEAAPVVRGGRHHVAGERDQVAGEPHQVYEPDPALREVEKVRIRDDINAHFQRSVRPQVPDAWMDRDKDVVGYEINFNRHFYKYTPPRPIEVIDAELKRAEESILRLLREVAE